MSTSRKQLPRHTVRMMSRRTPLTPPEGPAAQWLTHGAGTSSRQGQMRPSVQQQQWQLHLLRHSAALVGGAKSPTLCLLQTCSRLQHWPPCDAGFLGCALFTPCPSLVFASVCKHVRYLTACEHVACIATLRQLTTTVVPWTAAVHRIWADGQVLDAFFPFEAFVVNELRWARTSNLQSAPKRSSGMGVKKGCPILPLNLVDVSLQRMYTIKHSKRSCNMQANTYMQVQRQTNLQNCQKVADDWCLMKRRVRKHVLPLSRRWKISPHGVPRGGRYYPMHKNAGGPQEGKPPAPNVYHRAQVRNSFSQWLAMTA